jgi:hypothetical protein
MARPRYTAAKRAREQKQKQRREAKLARKHARRSSSTPGEATGSGEVATPAVPRESTGDVEPGLPEAP